MRRSTALRNAFLLLLPLLVLPAAVGQTPPPGPLPGGFSEIIDVRVVNLEVVVTDRDGIPVRGLGPDDLVLKVDGQEVPIEYFTEVLGGRAVRPPEGGETVPGLRAVEPGGRVGTSYLVFIDNFFSLAVDRNRVLRSLADSLFLGPEDRMAIVAFDGRQLEMLSSWSQDSEELRRVINRSLAAPARGLERRAERLQFDFERLLEASDLVLSADVEPDDAFRNYLDPNERYYVTRLAEQVERSVAAASATLRSFAMPPGRKVMLLLSGGWPFLPAEFLINDTSRFVLDRDILAGQPLYRSLVDTANLLGYTLYPVDVPGLDAGSSVDASLASPRDPANAFRDSAFVRETGIHASLRYLADQTGGKALINAARLRALESVVEDTRSFYWLGFSPQRGWDDRRHSVVVEARNPELRVRSRTGYLDSSRQREVSMAVESTLLFGNPPTEELLKIGFGEASRAGRGKVNVPLQVLVPLDQLTFLPAGEGVAARAELHLAVVDEDGGRSEIPVIPMAFALPDQPAAGRYGQFETTLKMRRGPQRIVVAVHDVASGRILSAGDGVDF